MANEPEWKPIVQEMIIGLERALEELQNIWQKIGYTEETRSMYYNQARDHMKSLLNDMVCEAQSKKQCLIDNIQDLLKQTMSLCAELHLEPKSYDQISLCQLEQMLQTDLDNFKCMKKERVMILKELLSKEHDICKRLGCKTLGIAVNVLPTEEDLETFKLYLEKQENEKVRLENVFSDIRCSILKMMRDLDISPSSPFEELICNSPEEFVLTANNMTKLREFRNKLSAQEEDRKSYIEKMKEDLLALWKYVDEPADVCQSFLKRHVGYSTATVNAFAAEIKRCKEKRKENILKYVTQIRQELENLWDLCKFCEKEREAFAPFYCNTFTENLLTLHELEVERLRTFYNDNRAIFELLEQRENLIMKVKELLHQANNPDRYHNRGGQLLMEEKERKATQKKLPKIEEELRRLVNEYEVKHNQTFTICGKSLEDVLAETWQNINHEKETLKKARKEAKDRSVKKSPLNSSKRTPVMSYLSIRKGPTLGLSKRKLFSPSPNTSIKRKNKNKEKTPNIIVSKVRRSGKFAKIQNTSRSSKGGQRKRNSLSPNNSITDTTYNQFQGHMTDREELHSSMLPEQLLRNVSKTPVRTPMKPLRKHIAMTPTISSARKMPHSPKINQSKTPKLATAPNTLPFIF